MKCTICGKDTEDFSWIHPSNQSSKPVCLECYKKYTHSSVMKKFYLKKRKQSSPSKLQHAVRRALKRKFGSSNVYEEVICDEMLKDRLNYRYDFYIESINCLVEVQGKQHYVYTKKFHKGMENFKESILRDKAKKQAAEKYGYNFVVIKFNDDVYSDVLYEKVFNKFIKKEI